MTLFRFSILFSWLFICGCNSVNGLIKAEPAKPAGFLPAPELLSEMRERYPFHGVWMNMKLDDFKQYQALYIKPIDTRHLAANDWWEQATFSGGDLSEDAKEFALESEQTFHEALMENMQLQRANGPAENTLILELSVVELVPAKVWLSSVGLAAFAVPLAIGIPAGTGAALGQNGTVAIEGVLKDGTSGEILLMFADREASKIRIIDFTTLTWYGHAHEIMEDWAQQLVEVLTTPHDHMVEDSDGFAWAPF